MPSASAQAESSLARPVKRAGVQLVSINGDAVPDFLGLSHARGPGESAVAENFFESAGQRLCREAGTRSRASAGRKAKR